MDREKNKFEHIETLQTTLNLNKRKLKYCHFTNNWKRSLKKIALIEKVTMKKRRERCPKSNEEIITKLIVIELKMDAGSKKIP